MGRPNPFFAVVTRGESLCPRRIQWFREKVALTILTTEPSKLSQLTHRFNTLGDHIHVHITGE
jgi:hypothetical protein